MKLAMRWEPERQFMWVDGDIYEHAGRPLTTPSHDLAHLVVAANGELPWKPSGAYDSIVFAEFNASFVQSTFMQVRAALLDPALRGREAEGIAKNAHYYANEHAVTYKIDFPCSQEEATDRLALAIRPDFVARLFPMYVTTVALELRRDHPPIRIEFTDAYVPPASDERDRQGIERVRELLATFKRTALSRAVLTAK